jgi:hypothetical protein
VREGVQRDFGEPNLFGRGRRVSTIEEYSDGRGDSSLTRAKVLLFMGFGLPDSPGTNPTSKRLQVSASPSIPWLTISNKGRKHCGGPEELTGQRQNTVCQSHQLIDL